MSQQQHWQQQQPQQQQQQASTTTTTTAEKCCCCYSGRRRLLRFYATVLLSASIACSILASAVVDAAPSMHASRGAGGGNYYTAVAEGPAESEENAIYMLRNYLRSLQESTGVGPAMAYEALPGAAAYLSAPEMVGEEATGRNGASGGGYLLIEDLKSTKRGLGPRPLRFGK